MRNLQISQAITNRETQSVEIYFNEIGKLQLISTEEEILLAKKIKQGDSAALDKLTKTNLRFVVSVAKKYQNHGLPLSDLISEGNIGLIRAAHTFDETRGFKFISYAVWWIRQSIIAAVSEHTRILRLPRNQINLLTKLNRVSGELETQLERQPSNEELAEIMGVSVDKIRDTRYYAGRTVSYDMPVSEEGDHRLIDILDNGERIIEDELIDESFRDAISKLLDVLTARERQIIELSYGFGGGHPMLPPDISPIVKLSNERVRQLKNEALVKLQKQAIGNASLLAQ